MAITTLSRQFDILSALTTQLQGITPQNGFAYDLSAAVFRGRTVFGDADPLPCLSILEAPRPGVEVVADTEMVKRKTEWELLIQGWAVDDKWNPLDPVYPLKASVEYQLARAAATDPNSGLPAFPAEFRLGKVVSTGTWRVAAMKIGPGVCRPPDGKLSSRAFFYLPLTIEYMEDLLNPFV
jgi:hypothetical protein